MTPRTFTATPLLDPGTEELRHLPEGPTWLHNYPGHSQLLGWVAIQHSPDRKDGSINLLDLASGKNTSFPLPGRPGFFVETTQPGVVLIGMDRRLVLFDLLQGRLEETGIMVTLDERVVINDGIAVPGGVIFGTKDLAFRDPIASLYRFDCGTRQLTTLMGGQVCSNGKSLVADGNDWLLVDVDSAPKTIIEYRLTHRMDAILARRLITPAAALPAVPDGLRLAPGGESVVVAYYNPAAVSDGLAQEIRLRDGAVLTEWIVPGSPRVTCPAFVEQNGRIRLILTTAVEGMAAGLRPNAPAAGTLFIAETPFQVQPTRPPLVEMEAAPLQEGPQ